MFKLISKVRRSDFSAPGTSRFRTAFGLNTPARVAILSIVAIFAPQRISKGASSAVTFPGDTTPPMGFFTTPSWLLHFDASRLDCGIPPAVVLVKGIVVSTEKPGPFLPQVVDYAADSPLSCVWAMADPGIIFNFVGDVVVSEVGVVFTDSRDVGASITLEAWGGFGGTGGCLADVSAFRGNDGTCTRNFAEDCFLGLKGLQDIKSIQLRYNDPVQGIELDMLRFNAFSEPVKSVRQKDLFIPPAMELTIWPSTHKPQDNRLTVSKVSTIALAGSMDNWNSTLDLTSNDLIVQATPETRTQSLAELTNMIKSARNPRGPLLWTGWGITSSTARTDATQLTGLGIALNENPDTHEPLYGTFDGLPVTTNDILVKYTWNGDANLDGVINADDYFLIDSNYIPQKRGWYNGDFNYDSVINADDYFLIDSAFLGQTGPLSAGGARPSTVPEPAGLALVAGGLLSLSVRRGGKSPHGRCR